MKIVTVIALSVAAALAAPALASASTYCVGSPSGGTCDVSNPGTAAGLQQALWGAGGAGYRNAKRGDSPSVRCTGSLRDP